MRTPRNGKALELSLSLPAALRFRWHGACPPTLAGNAVVGESRRGRCRPSAAPARWEGEMYTTVMTVLLLFPWMLLGVSLVGSLVHRRN